MLTRDDTWINTNDLIHKFQDIPSAIPDSSLRASVSNYFEKELRARKQRGKHPSKAERGAAAAETIRQFPELIDYYIKLKEDTGDDATDLSFEKVFATELFFSKRLREILQPVLAQTDFYKLKPGTYEEAHARLAYLKHVIEDMVDGASSIMTLATPSSGRRTSRYCIAWFGLERPRMQEQRQMMGVVLWTSKSHAEGKRRS